MKMIKMALLGGAALAVTAGVARADELADLKAQVESLNARVAQMEAAPSVPAGYNLLTISEGKQIVVPGLTPLRKDAIAEGDSATVISVLPTADAPAATEISWSGYARAAIVYWKDDGFDADVDVYARAQIKVTGKTDTAVGEVGATINLRGNLDGKRLSSDRVYVEQAWGWWAMTPELTLGGGFAGSLSNIGYGYDGSCNCYYTDNADVALNPGDTTQMRLTYASGPFSMAIALEDASDNSGTYTGHWGDGNDLGVAGEIAYAGDMFSGEVSGGWRSHDGTGTDDSYQIGAGIGMALGDMAHLSLAGAFGHIGTGEDYWGVSALASFNLSDEVHAEVAAGTKDYDGATADTNFAVLAGVYYDPVDQLTIGLEAEYSDNDAVDFTVVDLVTVFRF